MELEEFKKFIIGRWQFGNSHYIEFNEDGSITGCAHPGYLIEFNTAFSTKLNLVLHNYPMDEVWVIKQIDDNIIHYEALVKDKQKIGGGIAGSIKKIKM